MGDKDKKPLSIDEEAKAEEEFIADREDTVENPLVGLSGDEEEEKSDEEKKDEGAELPGAIGTGKLESESVEEPLNNELQASREAAELSGSTSGDSAFDEAANMGGVADDSVNNGNGNVEESKKGKKGPIIALIVVLAVLLVGGIGVAAYMSWRERPKQMLGDAVSRMIKSHKRKVSGEITFAPKDADENTSDISKITLKLDGSGEGVNGTGTGSIGIEYSGELISVNLSATYIEGGTLYFKVDGIKDAIAKVQEIVESKDQDSAGGSSEFAIELLDELEKKAEGQWYKFVLDELEILDEGEKEVASCQISAIEALRDEKNLSEVVKLYSENEFLSVKDDKIVEKKDGANILEIEIDEQKGEEFADKFGELDAVKAVNDCGETEENSSISDKEEGDGLETTSDWDLKELRFGIKAWSHELVLIQAKAEYDEMAVDVDLKLSEDDVKKVEAPENAKDYKELQSDFLDAYKTALSAYGEKMADEYCVSMSPAQIASCKELVKEQIDKMADEIDTEDVFDSLTNSFTL